MLTRQEVLHGYQLLLGRMPEDEFTISLHQKHATIADFVGCLMGCQEYSDKAARRLHEPPPELTPLERPTRIPHRLGPAYMTPTDLRPPPPRGHRALLIGQCLFDTWRNVLYACDPEARVEWILYNNLAVLPEAPSGAWEDYDFQMIQIPLRTILPESDYLRLGYGDVAGYQRMFDAAVGRLKLQLDNALAWTDRLPAFVLNYLSPQHNMMGRLQPRYDLRNPVYFIEKLNEALASELSARRNAHLLDADRISGVLGRRFIQDDILCVHSHGSLISDYDHELDGQRLIASQPATALYDVDTEMFVEAIWAEAKAMFATLSAAHPVKMVCVDLDDTLWRGVLAEQEAIDYRASEGWPLGVLEALAFLKKRGVLLAIVSKNDEARIRQLWPHVFGGRLSLDDFAILKISWRSKAETIAEAIREANVLPSAVAFLDDNPAERAWVKAALPDVRVIEAPHYYWKRILLWSAETQVAAISAESERRTEMIQAQVEREEARSALSRETFLAGLDLTMRLHRLNDMADGRYPRAFELLNKTNQFNTTGERWTTSEAELYLASGGAWWTFEVADRFTAYGLVGVVAVRHDRIDQFVMSCRVFGLDVETAILAALQDRLARPMLRGVVRETAANSLARDLYRRCGWREDNGEWLSGAVMIPPAHVNVADAAPAAAMA